MTNPYFPDLSSSFHLYKELSHLSCSLCGMKEFVLDEFTGELICKNCGLIIKERIMVSK